MGKGSARRPGEMPPGAWEAIFKKPKPPEPKPESEDGAGQEEAKPGGEGE